MSSGALLAGFPPSARPPPGTAFPFVGRLYVLLHEGNSPSPEDEADGALELHAGRVHRRERVAGGLEGLAIGVQRIGFPIDRP